MNKSKCTSCKEMKECKMDVDNLNLCDTCEEKKIECFEILESLNKWTDFVLKRKCIGCKEIKVCKWSDRCGACNLKLELDFKKNKTTTTTTDEKEKKDQETK